MSTYFLRKGTLSEDALTGMVADIFAWWPDLALPFLDRARLFDGRSIAEPARITGHMGEPVVTAWPRWDCGEPDLVLEFMTGGRRSIVIIEAKLGAPKSSADEGGADSPSDGIHTKDQLAKYHREAVRGLAATVPPERVDVVYLTHHPSAPMDELVASHRAMQRTPIAGGLYWISWRDVEHTLRGALENTDGAQRRVLASLLAVIAQEGFARFRGAWAPVEASAPAQSPARIFWRAGYTWCGPQPMAAPPATVFFEGEPLR